MADCSTSSSACREMRHFQSAEGWQSRDRGGVSEQRKSVLNFNLPVAEINAYGMSTGCGRFSVHFLAFEDHPDLQLGQLAVPRSMPGMIAGVLSSCHLDHLLEACNSPSLYSCSSLQSPPIGGAIFQCNPGSGTSDFRNRFEGD